MGLATAVRYCWWATAQTVSGFRPMPEENVLLIGIRDTYETERRRLGSSGVTVTGASLIRVKGICELWNPPPAGSARVRRVYAHLDLGVLNPERVAPVNEFAPSGGPVVQ
jgi:arginase